MREQIEKVKRASETLAVLPAENRQKFLQNFADLLTSEATVLLKANQEDLKASEGVLGEALFQRLRLTNSKIDDLAHGLEDLAKRPDQLGVVSLRRELAESLILEKVTVPLGVLAVVFESRPDVIPQILGLCIKSGNACVLKGGSEAHRTNQAFLQLAEKAKSEISSIPSDWCFYLETRESFQEILKYDDLIDLVIPRGSGELVRQIKESTRIPVMGHAEGICHIYVDRSTPLEKSLEIVIDAKCQYPAACNAVETLLVHQDIADKFLRALEKVARLNSLKLLGCEGTKKILPSAGEVKDWRTEYGDRTMAVRVVRGLDEAIRHINDYGSHHTDAILSDDRRSVEIFLSEVDSACVFSNASTRFSDGYRFGFGAEVGISTNKLHARGPVGIEGLLSYKYLLKGDGHTVSQFSGAQSKGFTHRDLKLEKPIR